MNRFAFQPITHDSFLTRLDFRPKLVLLFTLTLTAFVWESPRLIALLTASLLLACLYAGIKPGYLKLVLTLTLPFALLLIVLHGFFNNVQLLKLTGQPALTPLFALPPHWPLIGGLRFSYEGLTYGFVLVCKTLSMTLLIPLLLFTSDLDRMIVALVHARVPYAVTFIFASTLRFFPLLFTELQQIIEAQRLRGLAVEELNPIQRIQVYGRIAIPLILGSLVRSQQLEIILQSRGFTGSPNRTYLHESRLRPADYAVGIITLLLFGLTVAAYFMVGFGRFAGSF